MSKKGERSFAQEKEFLQPDGRCKWTIKKGFVPGMKVEYKGGLCTGAFGALAHQPHSPLRYRARST